MILSLTGSVCLKYILFLSSSKHLLKNISSIFVVSYNGSIFPKMYIFSMSGAIVEFF
jgi:hypothetical protein